MLAKYDSNGNLIWNKLWGGIGYDGGQSVIQSTDGGYVITGNTTSYGAGSNDMLVAKYDSSGSLVWNRLWDGSNVDLGRNIIQSVDGGYVIVGYSVSYGAGGQDMLLAKYDTSGNLSWNKLLGGTGYDSGFSLTQIGDGGYITIGYTASYGAGSYDMLLAKYDASGNLSWNKVWGGMGDEYGKSLMQTSDGGYVATGYTTSYGAGSNDMFLAKFKSDGLIVNCISPMCQTQSATVTTPSATITTPSATITTPSATVTTPSATITTLTATQTTVVAAP